MAALVVVLFPVLLLFFLLFMERVEAPLRRADDDVEEFLDSARQDEVDTLITRGLRSAMDRWRKRRRLSSLLPVRSPRRRDETDDADDANDTAGVSTDAGTAGSPAAAEPVVVHAPDAGAALTDPPAAPPARRGATEE